MRNRLLRQGVGEAAAEQWLVAWEAEGRSLGIDARSAEFWDEGARWIAEQRLRRPSCNRRGQCSRHTLGTSRGRAADPLLGDDM